MSAIGPFTTQPQRTRIMYSPQTGTTYEFYHEGPKSIIENLAQQYALVGLRVELSHEGPLYTLTVQAGADFYNTNPDAEVPQDDWEIDAEYVQESIWSNVNVIALAEDSVRLALWRNEIEEKLKTKPAPTPQEVSYFPAGELAIYRLCYLAGGINTAHEVRRVVLRRVRTVSIRYSKQVVLDAVEKIWPTAQLVRDFSIPEAISIRLPADPPYKPTDTTWAWKLRGDQSRPIIRLNRVEEHKTWTFAAWSNILYNPVA